MLPDPLHPAIVHLPIALAVLLPAFAIGALLLVRSRGPSRSVWSLVVALFALLASSSWLAVRTGEAQEERVEEVVAERPLESHEEAGERFYLIALAACGVSLLGLARGRAGTVGRVATTAATAVVLVAGLGVGRSGGELVYTHGAAGAYAANGTIGETTAAAARRAGIDEHGEAEEDEEDRDG